jgi:parallel beta-helix repeat protein
MEPRYFYRLGAVVLAVLLAAALAGCSHASAAFMSNAASITAGLPVVSGLDALRGASVTGGWPARVRQPVAAQNTKDLGAGLFLMAPGDNIAYAVYRLDQPPGALLNARASGSGALWVVAADYADNRWELAAPVLSGQTTIDLSALGNPVSPGGYIYCAVVCAQNTSGLLDAVALGFELATTGHTYHVASGGVDGAEGTEAAPWATLQFAADKVGAGDTVLVHPGNYAGFHLQMSGTPDAPVRFIADTGVQITSDNPDTPDGINIEDWSGAGIHDVEIAGFTVNNRTRTGIRIAGTDTSFAHNIAIRNNTCDANGMWGILTGFVNDMRIEGNTCTNTAGQHGIYFSNSGDYVTIRNNTCAHNHDCGIHMNGDASMGDDGMITGALVECNTVYDNGSGGGSAINCDGVQHSTIRNNLLYNNHASGISLYRIDAAEGAHHDAVLNNTIVMAADSRWCLNIVNDSTDAVVFNNVLYNAHTWHGSISIDPAAISGFVSDYNAVVDRFTMDDGSSVLDLAGWRTATSQDAHSFTATLDQMFTNPAGDNYNPAALSPLRDTAYAPYAPPLDIIDMLRPLHSGYDIGAYEGL